MPERRTEPFSPAAEDPARPRAHPVEANRASDVAGVLGLDLVMFAQLSWDGAWYSRHHLIRGLAARHRVVAVDPAPTWREVVAAPRSALRGEGWTPDAQNVLRYRSPRWLPEVYRGPGLRRALVTLRAGALRRFLARNGMTQPILYAWHPDFQETVSVLGSGPVVYHCYDKYDRYAGAPVDEIRRRETWLARRASLCVAASTELAGYLESLGARHVVALPHGVDPRVFQPGQHPPPELGSIPRPRLGLAARLNEVLDVGALAHIATHRPDWSLVLVGGAFFSAEAKRAEFNALCRLSNVHWVGERPRSEIPRWLSGLDVALICYNRTAWGAYNQPIKMYEYLACGLPVVSTRITAAQELGDLIRCCDDHSDWVREVEGALADRSPGLIDRRLAFAAANSWDRRVTELDDALHGLA